MCVLRLSGEKSWSNGRSSSSSNDKQKVALNSPTAILFGAGTTVHNNSHKYRCINACFISIALIILHTDDCYVSTFISSIIPNETKTCKNMHMHIHNQRNHPNQMDNRISDIRIRMEKYIRIKMLCVSICMKVLHAHTQACMHAYRCEDILPVAFSFISFD